jgi:hypothetical protein
MATAAASSGEEAQAVWAYERLLAIDPAWQPPSERSPRLTAALDRAREELPPGAALSVSLQRPATVAAGRALTVALIAGGDALGLVRGARVYHRLVGSHHYSQVTARGGAPVEVVVPASATRGGSGIDLWAAALDEHGNELTWAGTAEAPARVLVSAATTTGRPSGPRDHPDQGGGVLGRWWFWTGAVAIVAGAAVLTVLLTQPQPDCPAQRACFDVRIDEAGPP